MNIELQRLKNSMTAQTYQNDVAANNLANINTTGFKRDVMFFDILSDVEAGSIKMKVETDYSQGNLKETGNMLDMALSRKGFFAVERDSETLYTRDGHFQMNGEGILTTSAGYPVLGEGGWIYLSTDREVGNITVSKIGEIFNNDKLIDSLRIVDFDDYSQLSKAGENLFKNPDDSSSHKAEDTLVIQGNLEGSNVSPVNEMIGLMDIQRSFESTQRAVSTLDKALRKAVNEVGRYR